MKAVIILLIIISLAGCRDFSKLNDKIYEAQKQAILTSPYKSAYGATIYIDVQKKFRLNALPKLIRSKIYPADPLKDTVYIMEIFDAICINCPSDQIKMLLNDTIYSVRREISGHKGRVTCKVETEPFDLNSNNSPYELRNSELIEIVGKIRKGESWATDPLQYGSDHCNDGDHTIVTVIYPGGNIEAMYIRCWMPSIYRNMK